MRMQRCWKKAKCVDIETQCDWNQVISRSDRNEKAAEKHMGEDEKKAMDELSSLFTNLRTSTSGMDEIPPVLQGTLADPCFQIEDVEGDNACFYRAIANYKMINTQIGGEVVSQILGNNILNNIDTDDDINSIFMNLEEENIKVMTYFINKNEDDITDFENKIQNKIKPKYTIEQQFIKIGKMNVNTPLYYIYDNADLTEDTLPEILANFRDESDYEIDGIVMENNVYNSRYKAGNPKYAKAFKMEMLTIN